MSDIAPLLLPWFDRHGRKDLPWQQQVSAYRVWLSEIMLQQTQVNTVIPYFERFIESFPDVQSLARAQLDEVLKHWAGLGYYARARNLHKAAQIVRDNHKGEFPRDLQQLQALPGIGRSTAGAILSLACGLDAAILDGNVKRVLARVFQVPGWPGQSVTLKDLWALAEQQTPHAAASQYNQAMMDLGALICKRSSPACGQCPLPPICLSYKQQTQLKFPQSRPAKKRPQKHRWMLLHQHDNRLLLEHRPPHGIWGGLWSLPELESLEGLEGWQRNKLGYLHAVEKCQENLVKHPFSHFDLSISIAHIPVSSLQLKSSKLCINEEDGLQWVDRDQLKEFGLPAPIDKILSSPL